MDKWMEAIKHSWIYFAVAIILWIVHSGLKSRWFPPEPVTLTYYNMWGIPVLMIVPSIFIIFVGLGFMVHGIKIVKVDNNSKTEIIKEREKHEED